MDKSITTRKELIDNIRNWVLYDSQLKIINEKLKKIRENKSELTKNICEYAKMNNVNSKIEISDGTLSFCEKKEYSPLTYGYVEKCLGELIADKGQVQYIINYMKEKREITITNDIKRNYSKNLQIKN
jgi:hypothetical protein|tara:strand:- start:1315 stop:1698 length:384 start_codon:yes stop_codon:yes gene_type:complete